METSQIVTQIILAVWAIGATYAVHRLPTKQLKLIKEGRELYEQYVIVKTSAIKMLEDEAFYQRMKAEAEQHKAANK